MDAPHADDILTRLAEGTAADDELLACARWALESPEHVAHWRTRWPTQELPILGAYYAVALLGKGASGTVFKALSLRESPTFVALKLLQSGSLEAEGRFREREVEILRTLRTPHVARYLDSGTSGGTMFLAMELVRGRSLSDYLAAECPTLEAKLRVFQRVCRVLAGVHAEGVVHRDLKPKHVLVDDAGQPWIVDFGLSTVRGEDWPTQVRRAQTELGHILGTVKYMSPEQAWGGLLHVDHRADIWSLGIMLYEIVTDGGYPYDLDPIGELTRHDALLHRIQTEMPKPPQIAAARYAAKLTTLLSRCLAHQPERRIDSAATLADDLDCCLADRPMDTQPLPWTDHVGRIAVGLAARWRFGLWAATVGAILVLLFVVSVVGGVRWRVSGADYGSDTRAVLAGAELDRAGFVVVGISDASTQRVPELAAGAGIPDVRADVRTWRAVHGRIMERLAHARPRIVLWDFFFRIPRAGDAAFVAGARTLERAGAALVLAVEQYTADGRPELSRELYEPIADFARHGVILIRDTVARGGGAELVIALRRGETVIPSAVLAAFAAVVHPDCAMAVDWRPPAATNPILNRRDADLIVWLNYRPASSAVRWPAADRVELTTFVPATAPQATVQPGDVLLCKAFDIDRPAEWEARTVPYESVLAATDAELAAWFSGRVVVIGDLRTAASAEETDRHRVRMGAEIVDDVPGCYLLADGLRGLLANRSLTSGGAAGASLGVLPFVGVASLAFVACLLPPRWVGASFCKSRARRWAVLALLLGGAGLSTAGFVLGRSWAGVHAGMFGTAVCLALAASFWIEFTRHRYRAPRMG